LEPFFFRVDGVTAWSILAPGQPRAAHAVVYWY
jgi:hypothetical protein